MADKRLLNYETKMWNPVLFAIYYKNLAAAKLLLDLYAPNFTLALRLPPMSDS
jgi:hypothetical protein